MQIESKGAIDILPEVYRHVVPASRIYGDENRAYSLLEMDYYLKTIKHLEKRYVVNGIHTNLIESVWALLKRIYTGIHHHWNKKHTQRYLNSCVFRVNRQDMLSNARVDDLLALGMDVRLTYKELCKTL